MYDKMPDPDSILVINTPVGAIEVLGLGEFVERIQRLEVPRNRSFLTAALISGERVTTYLQDTDGPVRYFVIKEFLKLLDGAEYTPGDLIQAVHEAAIDLYKNGEHPNCAVRLASDQFALVNSKNLEFFLTEDCSRGALVNIGKPIRVFMYERGNKK